MEICGAIPEKEMLKLRLAAFGLRESAKTNKAREIRDNLLEIAD
jgi:hypothetical protein